MERIVVVGGASAGHDPVFLVNTRHGRKLKTYEPGLVGPMRQYPPLRAPKWSTKEQA